ncbi:MAG: alkyl sulfatase dimerization domain-containing protein [Actinomycetota bacterium]
MGSQPNHTAPGCPHAAAAAVRSAITDPAAVIARARELADAGETQLALHVIDVLALDPTDDEYSTEARSLKAALSRARASEVEPFVSKSCCHSSARLLDDDQLSWTALA